ncbi:MAG: multiheme c-type cytochrome [Deltaproteobacteria bacterium]
MRRLVIALGTLLVAGPAVAADFIGAEQCGTCHEKEYADWKKSGHATALAHLTKRQADDAACRGCHTTAPESRDPRLAGVQCESCHGAGSLYAPDNVMRDERLSKLLGLEKVDEQTCRPCHAQDTPNVASFVYAEAVKLVNHSRLRSAEAAPEVEAGSP